MSDVVECHSEHEYAEKPTALLWEGKRLEIKKILEEWLGPGEKCFRVETEDEQDFLLIYQIASDQWQIEQS